MSIQTIPSPGLSVLIPIGNCVDTLEDCLASVSWADEVVVIDSYSSDGSYELAQAYADKVVRRVYDTPVEQKNAGLEVLQHSWVLLIDSDERVPRPLRQEIQAALHSRAGYAAYRIPRLNMVLGAPVWKAGYYPDYQVRLMDRRRARFADELVHERVETDGPCGTLHSPLVHYTHRTVDQTLQTLLLQWARLEARQRQRSFGQRYSQPRLALNLLFRPPAAFIWRAIRHGGVTGGLRGLALSILWSMYVATTYLRIWESELNLPRDWWMADWRSKQAAGEARGDKVNTNPGPTHKPEPFL